MSRIVVLAGGSPHAHDFGGIGRALAEIARSNHHYVEVVDHPDLAARLLDQGSIDALVMNGLWWRMHGTEYDDWRDDYAYSPPAATKAALTSFVSNGGGLLAGHTTPICFDDWPEWAEIVGGAWCWGVSSHPPVGSVTAHRTSTASGHPVIAGLPDTIDLYDEVYGDLAVGSDVEVLMTAKRHAADVDQPVVWAHRYGDGRTVFDGFGHNADSIGDAHHRRLIEQALAWVLATV